VAYLAATSGLPIVPVRITGIEYMSGYDFWWRQRKLVVTFGELVYFRDLSEEVSTDPDKNSCEQAAVSLMQKIVVLVSCD